ncbi:molybdopterin-guanine dinucleotide biosynthesis protein MobB [Thioalkalivibrio sp. HK1]|uniref:molybdopterin-guanine dinucleotide biosynthesis protein MobB n=1 Tax=Thioalkalivibrio sp. HK1 TaxID=1469245 RepID=UPI00046E5FA3|nr:molybdopterin-guanine dinucleotide biosynthesis protein MobB [Thioalkalivibrio sp. HK1]
MLTNAHVPIIGFAAWSGTGKTTLLRRLLPILAGRGIRTGMIKHAHHDFDVDTPGKDSYELRKAGATQMLISSRRRWALMVERPIEREPSLDEILLDLDQEFLDLILVEGFKHERFPKIELHRPDFGRPMLHPKDDTIIAMATDAPPKKEIPLPLLDLNDPQGIADYLIRSMAAHLAPSGAPNPPVLVVDH